MMKDYNRIKVVLTEKKVSQVRLAEQLGKSKATIYNICDNRSQPHLIDLYRIAQILEVTVCELLNDPPKGVG